MHQTRRFFFFTLLACMALSHPLPAAEDKYNTEERSCVIRPSWALGGLVVVAILAIALQSGGCHGDHYHRTTPPHRLRHGLK